MMSHIVLSYDLIVEILSLLNIKSLIRFKCVAKFWNTLISDPTFVKLHLQRSPRNKHIAILLFNCPFVTFPLNNLIENPSNPVNPCNRLKINDCKSMIGSCNGLICFLCFPATYHTTWFRIWNPATNTISTQLGFKPTEPTRLRYTFVYDDSTRTYKVVVMCPTNVKIFNFGDNSWRTISSFPHFKHVTLGNCPRNNGVYLSGTINWFGIGTRNLSYEYYWQYIDQFLIISFDLGTETYRQFSPPRGIGEVPYFEPTIAVLMDRLCFSYNIKGTHFVIWQMTEFGVEQSWTQFLKISFQNLGEHYQLFPLCISENGHTLILASLEKRQLILYNLRDNSIAQISDTKTNLNFAKIYVESLASIC